MSEKPYLVLASERGILRAPVCSDGKLNSFERSLEMVSFEAVTRDSAGTLYAASEKGQIYRSRDHGKSWSRVFDGFPNMRSLWSLVAHPVEPGLIYAGLEPVSLWVSRDGGSHWVEQNALRKHPTASQWNFFPPSEPHIRSIAFDRRGERLHIGIEVGGVLISRDGGQSFEERSDGVHQDIHTIHVSPENPDHLFAMTGGGIFRSCNGGRQWDKLSQGLKRWYMVPLTFVAKNPHHLCAGAGNQPPPWADHSADAAIYTSEDGGEQWQMARGPFPLRGMVYSIMSDPVHPHHLYAGTTDGVLLFSENGGREWKLSAKSLPRIEEFLIAS